MSPSPNFHAYHDSRFDPHIVAAHNYVTNELGLQHVASAEKVTVVHGDRRADFVSEFGLSPPTARGWNIIETGDVIAVATPENQSPAANSARLGSTLTHELTHSGTLTKGEHAFYIEGIAGLAETRYLTTLRERGRIPAAGHYLLDRAGVRLFVPGEYRYSSEGKANASQGLIAASGLATSQQVSGIGVGRIMRAARPGGSGHFDLMKQSLNELRPGLAKEVTMYPDTTDGIIQATAVVHNAARRRGIIPQLPRYPMRR